MNPKTPKNLSDHRQFAIVMVFTAYLCGLLFCAWACTKAPYMDAFRGVPADIPEHSF